MNDALNCDDSTSNQYNGTRCGSTNGTINTTGKVGGAIAFAGLYEGEWGYYNLDNVCNVGSDDFTISAWFTTPSSSTSRMIIFKRKEGLGYELFVPQTAYAKDMIFFCNDDNYDTFNVPLGTGSYVYDDEWHFVYAKRVGNTSYANVDNGTLENSDTNDDVDSLYNTYPLHIGARGAPDGSLYYRGNLDEIRISKTARSDAWLSTVYNNQNNTATFIAIGNEETI